MLRKLSFSLYRALSQKKLGYFDKKKSGNTGQESIQLKSIEKLRLKEILADMVIQHYVVFPIKMALFTISAKSALL
ncbi:MAG: hypothetical protein A2096_04940 [Spirochaetes bacterium GWF1_41_5]|nr:MAG: hypothetical protein A2096_04940 [Spirochaetes bacterium GWF1_41_5]HBE02287.1 hypothetical protein [Spirochaetia bacterium]